MEFLRRTLVYLVPRVKEQELTDALRENGFVWRESRSTFSVYVLADGGDRRHAVQ